MVQCIPTTAPTSSGDGISVSEEVYEPPCELLCYPNFLIPTSERLSSFKGQEEWGKRKAFYPVGSTTNDETAVGKKHVLVGKNTFPYILGYLPSK